MLDLLNHYSLTEIITFIILLSLSIKGVIDFYDWAKKRIKEPVDRIYTDNFQADFNSIISIRITSDKEETYLPGDIIISGNYTPTEIENEYIVNGEITITASSARPI